MGLNAVPDPLPGCRVCLADVSWETYETLLRDRGDACTRMAYDRGTLEIRSPHKHERTKHLLARAIEIFAEERKIDIRGTGSLESTRQVQPIRRSGVPGGHHLKHPLKKRTHDPEEKVLLADLHHHLERPDRGWMFEPAGRELLAEARRFIERLVSESETRFLIAFRELVRKNPGRIDGPG
jgi:hypothetical protein